MVKWLTPADIIFLLLGRPEEVGRLLGLHEKSPYYWKKETAARSVGDLPSARIMRALLDHARAHGIPLTAEHLIHGAPEDEIAALVAGLDARRDAA